MRSLIDGVLALPMALLPRRYWQSFDLPVEGVAPVANFVTLILGFVIGISGYFAYLERLRRAPGVSILEIAERQVRGELPESAVVSAVPGAVYMLAPVSFALSTPLGLLATYLVFTSIYRIAASYIDEAQGDPLLTGVDAAARRWFGSQRERNARTARERLEGAAEPDRRYDGAWAGLTGVDFVIVSSRRKPGWDKGTWVITAEGWFVLGEPFDRPMPNGVRTVYPLTAQTTLEAVRKSVQYELPPLRHAVIRGTQQV